jgi:hypothetical protein
VLDFPSQTPRSRPAREFPAFSLQFPAPQIWQSPASAR